MAYLGVLAALVIGGIALFVWYKLHQSIVRSDSLDSPSSRKSRGGANNSLEEFIAAYRRGEVAADGAVATAQTTAAKPDAPAVTVPVRRDQFLSGAVKLAYYLCKTGLKDHHVFAHVQLATLATNDVSDAALARGSVDLVVCNSAMSVVAAIDVIGAEGHAPDATKADYLRSLGIRYLRLSAKSLPKPEEIQALLYRM
ncbi:MAG TPA: hypothetical protein VGR01_06065 [Burkholderiales bacterium]|jgi:hypothetical protein|nr:hypothetical protein [Burkholderiales bacterium]